MSVSPGTSTPSQSALNEEVAIDPSQSTHATALVGHSSSSTLDDLAQIIRGARSRPSFAWALGAPFAMLATSLVTNAVVSRALGPRGFGPYAVATAIATLLGIALGAGMPSTLVRYTAGMKPGEAQLGVRTIAWRVVVISTVVVAALFLAVVSIGAASIHSWVPTGSGLAILAAGIGAMLAEMAAAERQSALRFFDMFVTNGSLAVSRLFGATLGIVFVGPTVTAALGGYGAGTMCAGVCLAWLARRQDASARTSRSGQALSSREWRPLVSFGLPIMLSSYIIATIGYLDTLVLAKVLTPADLGGYAAGSRLTIIHSMLISGLTTVALPIAARAVAAGELRIYFRRALYGGLIASAVAILGVALLGGPLVRFVYGAGFERSATVFTILTIGLALNFPGNPISQLLYAAGRPKFLLVVHVGELIALIVSLPIAARFGGAIFVAVAWSSVNLLAVTTVILRAKAVSRSIKGGALTAAVKGNEGSGDAADRFAAGFP